MFHSFCFWKSSGSIKFNYTFGITLHFFSFSFDSIYFFPIPSKKDSYIHDATISVKKKRFLTKYIIVNNK
jgi:hypothetical protein